MLVNRDHIIEYVNRAPDGKKKDELIGASLYSYVQSDYHELYRKFIEKVFITGQSEKIIVQATGFKGIITWYEALITPFNNEGKNNKIIISNRDITVQKNIKAALKTAQEQIIHKDMLDLLLNNIPEIIIITDLENKIKYVNHLLPGYNMDNVIGSNFYDYVSIDYQSQHEKIVKECIKTGKMKSNTIQVFNSSNQLVWFEIRVIPLKRDTHEIESLLYITTDITKKKETDQKLKDQKEMFELLLINIPDIILIVDLEYKIKYINHILPGYNMNNVLGSIIYDYVPIKDHQLLEEMVKECIKTGKMQENIVQILDPSNQLLWFETRIIPLRKITNKIESLLFITNDVTKIRETQFNLKKSEKKYRELVNNANSIIIKLNKKGEFLFINEYGEQFFGYSKDELIGRSVIGTIVPKTESSGRDLESLVSEVLSNPDEYKNMENENITKSGKKVWVSWANKAIKDEKGNIVGVLTVGTDITEKKETGQKLIESEEKFRIIAEQSLMGIAIIKDLKYLYVNQQYADFAGYSREEMLSWKNITKTVHPDSIPKFNEIIKNYKLGEHDTFTDMPFKCLKKSGESFWINIFSRPIIYQGKLSDLITAIDITEKVGYEMLLQEENERLIELNNIKKELINRVSHELKTPLTAINFASEILFEAYKEEEPNDLLEIVKIQYKGCKRLKRLIKNFLDISSLETKQLELDIQSEDLVEIIQQCVNDLRYLAEDRNVKLSSELPRHVFLKVDKFRIQQVITNIISNAIKNTFPEGHVNISLREEKYIDIVIRDSGVGLTEKEKALLFKIFGKIERYGMNLDVDIEGAGLGLYIAREIVELHGGKIYVESEGRFKGSTFTIRLNK